MNTVNTSLIRTKHFKGGKKKSIKTTGVPTLARQQNTSPAYSEDEMKSFQMCVLWCLDESVLPPNYTQRILMERCLFGSFPDGLLHHGDHHRQHRQPGQHGHVHHHPEGLGGGGGGTGQQQVGRSVFIFIGRCRVSRDRRLSAGFTGADFEPRC